MKPLSYKRRFLLEALRDQTGPVTTWAAFNFAHGDYSTGQRWTERKTDTLNRMAVHGWIERCGRNKHGELLWLITSAGRARLAADLVDARRAA